MKTAAERRREGVKQKAPVKSSDPVNRLADLLYGGELALKNHPDGLLGEKGIGVAAFAKKVRVSRQMFYKYLGGYSLPSPETAELIIRELGISPSTFEVYCGVYERER